MFSLTNTLTGKKESVQTRVPNKVSLYACGITPYANAHIGHGRSYISFDLLYRWLTFLGNEVTYVRNFTDIDDKLLNKAQEEFGDQSRYQEIANKVIEQYQQEMAALNNISPAQEPRVTMHIPIIINFIQDLVNQGHAYQSNGDVYFSIESFPAYGKLSKQQIGELRAGERVDVDDKKRDPLDFALWKSEPEGSFWQSPWGWGRPGWHIECSAMASHYLGDEIDIHGGGRDLIFPHHENEIAQSEARSGKPFARYWMHNGLVNINKEKMSKSLGNFLTLEDILKKYDPMVLRYYFLTHHYHSPMEFAFDDLDGAQKSYKKLCNLLHSVPKSNLSKEALEQFAIPKRMIEFLADDLNTTGMFGVIFESFDAIAKDHEQASGVKQILQDVLGLTLEPITEKKIEMTDEIKQLVDERERARADKNWARADELRDKLRDLGYQVQDRKK